jgi:hypothetical protein
LQLAHEVLAAIKNGIGLRLDDGNTARLLIHERNLQLDRNRWLRS